MEMAPFRTPSSTGIPPQNPADPLPSIDVLRVNGVVLALGLVMLQFVLGGVSLWLYALAYQSGSIWLPSGLVFAAAVWGGSRQG